jgi:hypothetical protein
MKNFPKINLVEDALHGMAYYIFLKSLRSPEEFRKNPHVKIPTKSPSTNFPSLGKFKIQFLFEKNSSSEFSTLGPAGLPTPPALACRPAQAIHPLSAHAASQPTRPSGPHGTRPSSSSRRPSAASPFSHATAPWAPPLLLPPMSRSRNGNPSPHNHPPLQSAVITSPLHPR